MASGIEVVNLAQLAFWNNKPSAELVLTTTQAVATGTNVQINFTSATYDNWNGWSAGTPSRYTVQVAGMYRIDGLIFWATGNATGLRDAQLYYNGALISASVASWATVPNAGTFTQSAGPVHQFANVGDYFQLNAFQSSGSSLNAGSVSSMLVEFLHF